MEERDDRPLQDPPDLRGSDFRYDSMYGMMANSAQIEGPIVNRGVANAAMIGNERNDFAVGWHGRNRRHFCSRSAIAAPSLPVMLYGRQNLLSCNMLTHVASSSPVLSFPTQNRPATFP